MKNIAQNLLLIIAAVTAMILSTQTVQAAYTVKGNVVDSVGAPVDMGNVIALNPEDSSLLTGTYFADGKFVLTGIDRLPFLLKITALGYNEHIQLVSDADGGKEIEVGTISLGMDNMLPTFVVQGTVPMFEQNGGNTIVNVEKTMLASSNSSGELLAKIPAVSVTDGDINVFGRGKAIIYKDGKRITYQQFESIPVSQIEKVEVINNPSAKYDAEGRAVILVHMKVNTMEGWQGTLNQNATYGLFFIDATSLSLNYKKKKLSLSGDYNFVGGRDWTEYVSTKTLNTSEGTFVSVIDGTSYPYLRNVSNYRAGLSYNLTPVSNISLEYDGQSHRRDKYEETRNVVYSPENDTSSFATLNDGSGTNLNHSLTLNYRALTDTLGSSIFAAVQGTKFTSDGKDEIAETISDSDTARLVNRLGNSNSSVDLLTGKVDYNKVFKNASRFEVGGQYSLARTSGAVDFFSQNVADGPWISFPQYSNNFTYDEQIIAGYGQYYGTLKDKVNYALGARVEQTQAVGVSELLDSTIVDTTYLNVFPTANLNGIIKDKYRWNLSFASRINRPNYQDLDPFLYYQDSLNSSQGNPGLKPMRTLAVDAAFGYMALGLKVGYAHSVDAYRYLVLPGVTGVNSTIMRLDNVQEISTLTAGIEYSFDVKTFWSSYSSIDLNANKLIDDRPEFSSAKVIPQIYGYTYNMFNLKIFTLEVEAEYYSEQNDGIYSRRPIFTMNVGASRMFLDGKLSARFMVGDVFNSYRDISYMTLTNTLVKFDSRFSTHFYRLALSFNFGKLEEPTYINQSVNDQQFNRIKQ